ncbi:MAG: CDP-diacylglycerol--glycerol-3-phosphate 3-phosphatidyltransferase [Aquiluna sp.]|nr:CDP-diacylglycerol--glycerol-3-phosphate 3-phosphatidyltransferase [Aquiluna sp.]
MLGSSLEDAMTSKGFLYRQTPNLITMARLAMVPIILWLILDYWDFWGRFIALVLLVLAASTDGIDGAIARKRNLVSDLGKLLDPIADKALLSGSLIALSVQGAVPWAATAIILSRELFITVYRLVVAKRRVIAATGGGKFKTVMQIIAVSMLLAPFEALGAWWLGLSQAVLWFTVVLTVWSGVKILWPSRL